MGYWYKLNHLATHVGQSKRLDVVSYVYADDIMGVIDKYKQSGGVKRDRLQHVSVEMLSEEESGELERRIEQSGKNVFIAKQVLYWEKAV